MNANHIAIKRFKLCKSIVAMGFNFIVSSNFRYSCVKATPPTPSASDFNVDVGSDLTFDSSTRTRSWSAFIQFCNSLRIPIIT